MGENKYSMAKKLQNNNILSVIVILLLSIVYLLIFSTNTSPLYNWQVGDAAVFRMDGIFASKGLIPYIDFFDHKGPFLMLVEYLGACISTKPIGNLIVQIPFVFFSFFGLKRIVDLFVKDGNRVVRVLLYVVSILIYNVYVPHNMTEEYCLPFIVWSCYFALKYIINQEEQHKYSWSFLYGVTVMACAFTRLTNVMPLVGIMIVGMIVMIKRKDRFFRNLLFILIGMIAFALPFVVFFAINNGLYEMIYATIIYNVKYATNIGTDYTLMLILEVLVRQLLLIIFAIIVSIVSIVRKKNIEISYAVLISSVLAICLQLITNIKVGQYVAVQAPILVIAACLLIDLKSKGIIGKVFLYGLSICGLAILAINNIVSLKDLVNVRNNNGSYNFAQESKKIVSKMDDVNNSEIVAYNVQAYFYVAADVEPCYRYCVLQDWQSQRDKEMQKQIRSQFASLKADYIVENIEEDRKCDSIINKNYKEIYRTKQLKLLKRK